jgi:hypothetical protein
MSDSVIAESPLNTPIRTEPIPSGNPPWRDNAYVCFWDPSVSAVGVVHASVSPNGEGQRLRLSFSLDGRSIEIIEQPHDNSAFHGDTISYPLDNTILVRSDRVTIDLRIESRFSVANYSTGQVIPPLVPGEPLNHVQEAVSISGTVTFDGQSIQIGGDGFRDRTWGYRDESRLTEYISFMAVTPKQAFTALRFQGVDSDMTDGFVMDDRGTRSITGVAVTRDASGLLAAADLSVEASPDLSITVDQKHGGFWVPMGHTRRGPSFSAYDELCEITLADGDRGYAFVEHGIIRNLY